MKADLRIIGLAATCVRLVVWITCAFIFLPVGLEAVLITGEYWYDLEVETVVGVNRS